MGKKTIRMMILILSVPVHIYRWGISPFLPPRCRFMPSCSAYMLEALHIHGPVRGGFLGLKRICRCHPFGGSGFDPVPPGHILTSDALDRGETT